MAKLSVEDLLALWESSVDPEFARQLLEQPDSGIEVIEASAAVFALASDAIERSSQSLFLRPWSGQTFPPATGARLATVPIDLTRTAPTTDPLVLEVVTFVVEEQVLDAGPGGGVLVATGRRYSPQQTVVMLPGVATLRATCQAERPGGGYNLPLEGALTLLVDSGTATGDQATLAPGTASHRLVLSTTSETVAPSAVGQYVLFTAGANAGQRRRAIGYEAPNADIPHNGVIALAPTLTLAVSAVTGTFIPGELVEQSATGAAAALIDVENGYLVADRTAAPDFTAGTLRGVQSGATATVGDVIEYPAMVAETGTAGWQLLSWAGLGLTASNPEQPSGGASPTLDHIGSERDMGRSSGEMDDPYRARLYSRPDVVTPNALVRAMNRVLAPYGLTGCLREPSDLGTFAGFFYDAPANGPIDRRYAYDLDFDARPADRYKLPLDLAEFRAFFVASIPPMSLGEFGFAYDEGFVCFYDAAPFLNGYDGYAVTAAAIRLAVWNALNAAREGGVGFELVEDPFGC